MRRAASSFFRAARSPHLRFRALRLARSALFSPPGEGTANCIRKCTARTALLHCSSCVLSINRKHKHWGCLNALNVLNKSNGWALRALQFIHRLSGSGSEWALKNVDQSGRSSRGERRKALGTFCIFAFFQQRCEETKGTRVRSQLV